MSLIRCFEYSEWLNHNLPSYGAATNFNLRSKHYREMNFWGCEWCPRTRVWGWGYLYPTLLGDLEYYSGIYHSWRWWRSPSHLAWFSSSSKLVLTSCSWLIHLVLDLIILPTFQHVRAQSKGPPIIIDMGINIKVTHKAKDAFKVRGGTCRDTGGLV